MYTPLADARAGSSVDAMSGGNLHQQHPDCKQPRPHWFAGELSSPSVASSGRSPSLTSLESISSLESVSESALSTPTAPPSWHSENKKTKGATDVTVGQLVNKPDRAQNHHRGSSSSLSDSSGPATPRSSRVISSLVTKSASQNGSRYPSGPTQSATISAPNSSVSKDSKVVTTGLEYLTADCGGITSGSPDPISGVPSGFDTHAGQGHRAPDFFLVSDNSVVKTPSDFVSSAPQAEYGRKCQEKSAIQRKYLHECDRKALISQQFEKVRGVWSNDSVTAPQNTAVNTPFSQAPPSRIAEIRSKLASAGIPVRPTVPSQTTDSHDIITPRPPSPAVGSDNTIKAAPYHLTTPPDRSIEITSAPATPIQTAGTTIGTIAGGPNSSEALSSVPDPLSGDINTSSGLPPNLNLDSSFCFSEQQQQQQQQSSSELSPNFIPSNTLAVERSSKPLGKEEMSGSLAGGLPGGVGAGESSPEGEQMRLSGGARRGRGQFAAGGVGFLGGRARATDNWRQSAQSPAHPKPANDMTSPPVSAAALAPAIGKFSPGPSQGFNPGFTFPAGLRSPTAASLSSAPSGPAVLSPAARQQFAPFSGPSAAAGVFSPGTPTVSGSGLGPALALGGGSGFSPVRFSAGPSFVDPSSFASLLLSDPAAARQDLFAGQGQLAPAQLAHMGDAGTGNVFSPPTSQPQGMFGFPSSSVGGGGPATTAAAPATPAPRAQNWDLGQYQTQHLVTIGPETQGYCFVRPDGSRTRLVPVDMLPFSLVGIPATENDNNKLVELVIPAGLDKNLKNSNIDRLVIQSPPHGRHQDAIQNRIDHILLASAPQTTSAVAGPGSGPISPSVDLPRKKKIYCDKWVHEGTCAFTQQGCKYKHVMPMDKATQHELGLFHGLPNWWKKRQAELSRESERGSSERGGGVSVGGRFAAGGSGGAAGSGAEGGGGGGRKSGSTWSRWDNGSGGSGAGGASGMRRGSSSTGSESGFHSSNWRERGPTPGQ